MPTNALTIRATIMRGHDGSDSYAVSVTLKENGISRQLFDEVVPSCFAAATVARPHVRLRTGRPVSYA